MQCFTIMTYFAKYFSALILICPVVTHVFFCLQNWNTKPRNILVSITFICFLNMYIYILYYYYFIYIYTHMYVYIVEPPSSMVTFLQNINKNTHNTSFLRVRYGVCFGSSPKHINGWVQDCGSPSFVRYHSVGLSHRFVFYMYMYIYLFHTYTRCMF